MTLKLVQQIKEHEALNRVWIDEDAFPDPLLCIWCGATLALVDNNPDLTIRMTNFLKLHARCTENACQARGGSEDSEKKRGTRG